ncbi:integrase arm-type DNA-binding domain-containing protein [Sphingomonas sp. ASV193]|uniref:tyrosine-type recombinase/integrase n=1 Tax=Sphingomonas sp. ASV193 TaxID=3144405 RepID=UPI0032E88185
MPRTINRLTTKSVAGRKSPGLYADGGGLYLNVKAAGSRSWLFIYQWKGKRREKGLGSAKDVTLQEARDRRDCARKLLADGLDPLAPAVRENGKSFGDVAAALMADLELGWKNPKHRAQWRSTLETYCSSMWSRPVHELDTSDVLSVLRPIWSDKPETASRVRARMERVFDAAKVKGFRKGENPARWRGHLQLVLPGRTRGAGIRHHPAMPHTQIGDFVIGLKSRVSTAARALEFLIHTAARTSEVIQMSWREIDREARVWTVPAERMKAGTEHQVPLTRSAIAVLDAMALHGSRAESPVFPGRTGKCLSNMSMEMLLRRMGCEDATVHGFRSTFRDWAGDETQHPRELIEHALAHQVGNAAERAYRRGSALAKRRQLMEDWSDFIVKSAEG